MKFGQCPNSAHLEVQKKTPEDIASSGQTSRSDPARPDRFENPEDIRLRGNRHDTGALGRRISSLLLSGLYRRPRNFTGSCAIALAGCTADRELGCCPHPAPKASYSIQLL